MPYVAKMLSIPVWGVEVKKEVAAPLLAPFSRRPAVTCVPPHEQSGRYADEGCESGGPPTRRSEALLNPLLSKPVMQQTGYKESESR